MCGIISINLETLTGFNLPTTCTNVSNLFKGCYKLTRLTGLNLGSTISKGDNWCPPNLTTVENCTINTDKTKFKNESYVYRKRFSIV